MRVRAETKGERIITKHEWMMGILDKLEKHDKTASLAKNASSASSVENAYMLDEETPQMLYEALFIDPSKLTPYQHAQLEYQRQVQQKEMQANANNAAKRTLQNLASASASRLTKQHSVSPVIGVQPSSILVETIQAVQAAAAIVTNVNEESKENPAEKSHERTTSPAIFPLPNPTTLTKPPAVLDVKDIAPHILE